MSGHRDQRIFSIEDLPRLDPARVERIELRMPVSTRSLDAGDCREPSIVVDEYALIVHLALRDGTAREFALDRHLAQAFRMPAYGRLFLADEGSGHLERIRNRILDERLLPRDPFFRVKLAACVADAVERVQDATGVEDLDRYRAWIIRDPDPWQPVVVSRAFLHEASEAAAAIGFAPAGHCPSCVSGVCTD